MQANRFMGLWGKVFDSNNATVSGSTTAYSSSSSLANNAAVRLGERFQKAAETWKTEAEEARARLMHRFNAEKLSEKTGPAAPVAINDEAPNASTALGNVGAVPLQEDQKERAAVPLSKGNLPEKSTLVDKSSIKDVEDWLLRGEDGKLDGHIALASLKKHSESAASPLAASASMSDPRLSSGNSELGSVTANSRSLGHLGVLLPNSMLSHFDAEWCMRLQNFGNAEGYRSAVLGAAPCNSENSTLGQVKWASEAAFSLDCGIKTAEPSAFSSKSASESVSLPNILHSAAAKAASDFTTVLEQRLQRQLECTLAVATQGSGTVLKYSQDMPVFGSSKLNSLKIRTCNVPPSTVQYPAALRRSNTSLDLQGLKLNGHSLSVDEIEVRQALAGTGSECKVALLRLPGRAMVDGFVLNGELALETGSGVWGVGEMASVEVQIGTVRLLHAAASSNGGGGSPFLEG